MQDAIKALLRTSALYFACTAPGMAQELEPGGHPDPAVVRESSEELGDAQELVQEASQVVQQLRSDAETREALTRAEAVFIVPNYGRASLVVGGAAGRGVLVANHDGSWSAPAFYKLSTVNLGLQAGVEAGSIALLLMSDKALDGFREQNNFSLNADAGITLVNWSRRAQASIGKGPDVIVWSDTEGLYGNLSVSVTGVMWDGEANRAYYQKTVDARDIINGTVPPQEDSPLKSEFSALEEAEPAQQSPEEK